MRVFSEAQIGQGVPRAFDKAVRTWLPGLQRARVLCKFNDGKERRRGLPGPSARVQHVTPGVQKLVTAMRDGPGVGLAFIDAVLTHGELANYYLAHSARADMCRRLGRIAEARSSYEKALALTQQEPERKFLQERLRQLNQKKME